MVPLTLDGEAARQISRPDEGVGLGPFLRGDRQDGAMCVCEFVCVSVGLRLVIRQPVRLKVRPLAWSLPPPSWASCGRGVPPPASDCDTGTRQAGGP